MSSEGEKGAEGSGAVVLWLLGWLCGRMGRTGRREGGDWTGATASLHPCSLSSHRLPLWERADSFEPPRRGQCLQPIAGSKTGLNTALVKPFEVAL